MAKGLPLSDQITGSKQFPRSDLPAGCTEKLDRAFLTFPKFVWNVDRGYRPGIDQVRKAVGPQIPTLHLRCTRQIGAFLNSLPSKRICNTGDSSLYGISCRLQNQPEFMEEKLRIYITGASCAGVTTLGRNLATLLGVRQVDVDDFFWMPTNPPFTTKRPADERVTLIQQELGNDNWVLTGSCMGWGDALLAPVDLMVFVVTPTPVRLERLAAREQQRFGNRIAPGGDMHAIHVAFREWASQYDNPAFSGRNRAWHEAWLSEQTAPVLRVDGMNTPEKMVAAVTRGLAHVLPG